MSSQALAFDVRIMDGELAQRVLIAGAPPGVLRLAGRALPYQGMQIGGEQRVKHTFYPGNGEASEQLIGPTESPTTIRGTWKDRFLGDGVARQIASLVNEMRVRGVPVEVSFGMGFIQQDGATQTTGSMFVRRGIIHKATFDPTRPQDIGWEIEFWWRSAGRAAVSPIAGVQDARPQLGLEFLLSEAATSRNWAQAFGGFLDAAGNGMRQDFRNSIGALGDSIVRVSGDVNSVRQSAANLAQIPFDEARKLLGALDLAGQAAADFRTSMLTLPLGFHLAQDSALDLLRFKDLIFDVVHVQDNMQYSANQARDRVAAVTEPDFIAETRAPAGTDLRVLSQKYYGTPDNAFAIAIYNDFDDLVVPVSAPGPSDDPGHPVRIPRLTDLPSMLRPSC